MISRLLDQVHSFNHSTAPAASRRIVDRATKNHQPRCRLQVLLASKQQTAYVQVCCLLVPIVRRPHGFTTLISVRLETRAAKGINPERKCETVEFQGHWQLRSGL